jgi:hypothetical protein
VRVISEREWQYASLGRIAGYLRQQTILRALEKLHLSRLCIPVMVPLTTFAIWRRAA